MPKDIRKRSSKHERSVELNKKSAPETLPEERQLEATDAVQPQSAEPTAQDDDARKNMTKKEKHALKHELFVQRLESSRSPYSKSHDRRMKRKAKEQVAGGLKDMEAALTAVETGIPSAVQESVTHEDGHTTAERKKVIKPGRIGEGKAVTLSKSQRKRALQTERLRIPMILSNPEYATNPFQTLRTHAQNTLVTVKDKLS